MAISISGDQDPGDADGIDYSVTAISTSGVEKVLVSNFDLDDDINSVTTNLMTGLTTVGLSSSSATGDTVFSGMKNMVAAEMKNGAANLTLTYNGEQSIAGAADSQNLTVSNQSAGAFTANGIETLNIASETAKSSITISADALETVTVTGSADLNVGTLNFAANGTALEPGAVVDASAFTGKLTLATTASEVLDIKLGSGDDSITAGSLTKNDKIDGGAGADTLTMALDTDADAFLADQFAGVTGVETVKIGVHNVTDAQTYDLSELSVDTKTIDIELNDLGNAGKDENITNHTDQTIVLRNQTADADIDTEVVISNKVDTAADTLNVKVVEAVNAATTDIETISAGNYETINLESTKDAATTTAIINGVNALVSGSATALNISGDSELVLGGYTAAKLTSIDASELAAKLTVTLSDDKATVTGAQKDTTFIYGTNLNNDDTVIGGAGTKDKITATVNGLTATTGALNVSGVETIELTSTGTNTIALAGVTGLTSLSMSTGTNTLTGLDVANTALTATGAATVKVTAADATGADDTLVFNQVQTADTDNVIEGAGIENLSITVKDTDATAFVAGFDLDKFEASTVTFAQTADSGSNVNVDLAGTTLHKNVSTVNATGLKAAFTANASDATGAVTMNVQGAGVQTLTGGAKDDTFNIGATAGVVHAVTGGAGTDTTNISVKTGWVNPSDIATENVNITVAAGDDITITAGEGFNAATTAITLAGGNSLSTFDADANTNLYLADTVKTFDASAFAGNILVGVVADKLDDTVTITGGSLATDVVYGVLATAGTYDPKTVGVETLKITAGNDDTADQFIVDLSNTTGVTTVSITDVASGNAADTITVDKITSEIVQVVASAGTYDGATPTIIEAKVADATGATDAVTFELKGAAANSIRDGLRLKATDIETVTIKASSAESVSAADLSMATADEVMTLKVTGDKALTLSAVNADVTTIDASGMTTGGSFVQEGRSATAASTYTGSDGADTFIMMNNADVMAAGAGADTLDINTTNVLGGAVIDLSKDDVVVQANGSLNTAVQSGFTNVDLSGYAGGFGAVVTAHKDGSTITGTAVTDQITGGAGTDIIKVATAGAGNNDVVDGGAGTADEIIFQSGSNTLGTDANITNVEKITLEGTAGVNLSAQTEGFTITGSTGANSITSGKGVDTIATGSATNTLTFTVATSGFGNFDTITDIVNADVATHTFNLVDQGTEVGVTGGKLTATATDIGAAASETAAITALLTGDGGTNSIVKWGVYDGNTYLVQDLTDGVAAATDLVIKLTGEIDLLNGDNLIVAFA